VGFPGETEEDFQKTLNLVEQCKYDSLYIFKYSKRAGTPAAKLADDISESEKTERFLRLEHVQREAQKLVFENYVGRTVSVLAEKQSARSESDMVGHSTCHKVVNFPGETSLAGELVTVRITRAKTNSLYGERVRELAQNVRSN
jgi:tRNA-2-methylthio-N6-dimethylallyladenosine synthase